MSEKERKKITTVGMTGRRQEEKGVGWEDEQNR
jgi:hypothetical protein